MNRMLAWSCLVFRAPILRMSSRLGEEWPDALWFTHKHTKLHPHRTTNSPQTHSLNHSMQQYIVWKNERIVQRDTDTSHLTWIWPCSRWICCLCSQIVSEWRRFSSCSSNSPVIHRWNAQDKKEGQMHTWSLRIVFWYCSIFAFRLRSCSSVFCLSISLPRRSASSRSFSRTMASRSRKWSCMHCTNIVAWEK